jgi:hypothetical protein
MASHSVGRASGAFSVSTGQVGRSWFKLKVLNDRRLMTAAMYGTNTNANAGMAKSRNFLKSGTDIVSIQGYFAKDLAVSLTRVVVFCLFL